MATTKKANALIHATSPYLLQHAYNPVNWQEWNEVSLTQAKKEDKPILVSIGYSSCHWCHVMEHQSFEDADIASIMNEHFVCIKVDREERPDIDHLYMDAIQAMGINGGWPLNVFLTPDQKPFYGGTYFPPSNWAQLLTNIHKAYQQRRKDIFQTAEQLSTHLAENNIDRFKKKADKTHLEQREMMFNNLNTEFDTALGGLNKAPKFIMPSIWLWLLRYHFASKNQYALEHTLFTLKCIARGGIYDQLGGGFARYSVDDAWFVPHFEKMLYDNAQLVSLYSEAYTLTKDPFYKNIIDQTISWLQTEMQHPSGGFYSALDADSEGVEGKFYCWTKQEIDQILGESAPFFCDYFAVTEEGNWEHGLNILKRESDESELRKKYNLTEDQSKNLIQNSVSILLQARSKRIRPGLDDKILAGWNAMAISGLVDAFHATGNVHYKELAEQAMHFILNNMKQNGRLVRSFKNTPSPIEGFLEDYAFVIQALIKLYQAEFSETWLTEAISLVEYTIQHFQDKDGYFLFTGSNASQLIASKKELFDNVIPSSNAVMAANLFQLGTMYDRDDWKQAASRMVDELSDLITKEPHYMSYWGITLLEIKRGLNEVIFVGPECIHLKSKFKKQYQPFALCMGTKTTSDLPLLRDKKADNKTTIYVCFEKTCKLPVHTAEDALVQLQ